MYRMRDAVLRNAQSHDKIKENIATERIFLYKLRYGFYYETDSLTQCEGISTYRKTARDVIMAKSKSEMGSDEKKPNKRRLVASALETLGDVGPRVLQQHIMENSSVDISLQMISSYKSQILKGKKTGKRTNTSRASSSASNNHVSSARGSVDIADLIAVKALVDRIGASQLESLIQALAK